MLFLFLLVTAAVAETITTGYSIKFDNAPDCAMTDYELAAQVGCMTTDKCLFSIGHSMVLFYF
jgi:hypothetical protein